MQAAMIRITRTTALVVACLLASIPVSLAQSQGMPSFESGELPELIELSESDVKRFLSTAADLEALGDEMDDDALDNLDTLMGQQKALDIIDDNGFEPQGFMQVAFSIGMAYAMVGPSAEELAEMEAGMKQMEQMKASMSPEQWESVKEGMGAAFAMMEQIQNQPEGNIKLVEKYKGDLDELMGD